MRIRPDIDGLKTRLEALGAESLNGSAERFGLGVEAVDRRLQGLARHALHDIYPASFGDAAAAQGFALGLALRAEGKVALVWAVQEMADRETGRIHGPGLHEWGLDPGRVVLVRVRETQALLAAGEEALSSAGVDAVLLSAWGDAKAMTLTASRRLSLMAAKGRTTAILVRMGAEPQPSAADSRWRVTTAPSRALEANAPGRPAFEVELMRRRGGASAGPWIMEWDRECGSFSRPSLSGGLVPLAAGRPAAAGDARRRYG